MAICKVLLISEQEIKNLTNITSNVDVSKFCFFIPIAQDMYIKNAIGEACYTNLLDGVENDNLTPDEVILLDGNNRDFAGVKTALAWWVLYKAYPTLHAGVNATTVATKSGENFEAVDSKTLHTLRNEAKVNAEYYTDQIICFICENNELYPCYDECDDCTDRLKTGFGSSGIITDDDPVTLFDVPLTQDDIENIKLRRGL